MRKKKYIIAALSAGMCLSVIPGSTVSAEKQQADSGISSVVNNASDAVNVVSQISGLGYMGNQSYVRSLHRNEDNSSGLVPDTDSGILAAFPKDFDGDGSPEIFAVIYDGRVHFQMLRKSGESWEITSDQEIVSASEYQEFDYSSLDERCVKEEDSVFFRKYKGSYEFYYEAYDEGVIATGQEWFFKGVRLEDGNLNPIDETDSLYFSGSPIDMFWENFEGEAGDSIAHLQVSISGWQILPKIFRMDLPVRWKIKQEKYRRILRNFQVEALLQSRAVPHQIPQNTYCRMLMSDISAQMKLQG